MHANFKHSQIAKFSGSVGLRYELCSSVLTTSQYITHNYVTMNHKLNILRTYLRCTEIAFPTMDIVFVYITITIRTKPVVMQHVVIS